MEYTQYKKLANVTLGKQKADLVLKNLKLVDVFTGEIVESNVAVKDGLIAGVSRSYRGKRRLIWVVGIWLRVTLMHICT